MSASLDTLYFDFLYNRVCQTRAKKNPSKNHKRLLHILYTKEFVWLVPNDDNRVEDGRDLRYDFFEFEGLKVHGSDKHWLDLGCSVLEMMIALAKRFAFEAGGSYKDRFWEMMQNLGLGGLNDSVEFSEAEVDEILDRLIWRTYEYNGSGGLFPLIRPERDQRKVELWYQLSSYVLEHDYI